MAKRQTRYPSVGVASRASLDKDNCSRWQAKTKYSSAVWCTVLQSSITGPFVLRALPIR